MLNVKSGYGYYDNSGVKFLEPKAYDYLVKDHPEKNASSLRNYLQKEYLILIAKKLKRPIKFEEVSALVWFNNYQPTTCYLCKQIAKDNKLKGVQQFVPVEWIHLHQRFIDQIHEEGGVVKTIRKNKHNPDIIRTRGHYFFNPKKYSEIIAVCGAPYFWFKKEKRTILNCGSHISMFYLDLEKKVWSRPLWKLKKYSKIIN